MKKIIVKAKLIPPNNDLDNHSLVVHYFNDKMILVPNIISCTGYGYLYEDENYYIEHESFGTIRLIAKHNGDLHLDVFPNGKNDKKNFYQVKDLNYDRNQLISYLNESNGYYY